MNDYASLARRLEGALGAIEVVGDGLEASARGDRTASDAIRSMP